ncbi:MAG: PAS domain S-box protein [Bacteroidetes bacterium]|nr:PAS domain S-box protein [Bacteroidota bacterium]
MKAKILMFLKNVHRQHAYLGAAAIIFIFIALSELQLINFRFIGTNIFGAPLPAVLILFSALLRIVIVFILLRITLPIRYKTPLIILALGFFSSSIRFLLGFQNNILNYSTSLQNEMIVSFLGSVLFFLAAMHGKPLIRLFQIYTANLENKNKQLRDIFETGGAIKFILNPENGQIEDVNSAACNFYGYTYKEMVTMKIAHINIRPEKEIFDDMQRALEMPEIHLMVKHRLANGEVRDVEVFGSPFETEKGKRLHVLVHDISERQQYVRKLEVSESKFRAIMETSQDFIYIVNERGVLVESNKAFLTHLGITEHALGKISVMEWDAKYTAEELTERLKTLIFQGQIFETVHRRRDGTLVPVEIRINNVIIEEKNFLYCVARDITRKKKVLEELQRSEILFRNVWEQSKTGLRITDGEGKIVQVNDVYCALTGRSREDLIGKYLSVLYPAYRTSEVLNKYRENFRQKVDRIFSEKEIELWNKKKVWWNSTNTIIEIPQQGALYLHTILDVTEQRRSQYELEQKNFENGFLADAAFQLNHCAAKEEVFSFISASLQKLLPEKIIIINRITDNGAHLQLVDILGLEEGTLNKIITMLGFSLLGKKFDIIEKFIDSFNSPKLKKITEGFSEFSGGVIPPVVGMQVERFLNIQGLYNIAIAQDSEVFGFIGIIDLDETKPINSVLIESFMQQCFITLKKLQLLRLLEESEIFRKTILNNIPNGVIAVSPEGKFIYANERAQSLFGAPLEKLSEISSFDPRWNRKDAKGNPILIDALSIAKALKEQEGELRNEYWITSLNGEEHWISVTSSPLYDSHGDVIGAVGSVVDLTERRKTDRQLHLQHIALEAAENGIVIADKQGKIEWMNKAYEISSGYSLEEAVGKSVEKLVHSDRHEKEYYEKIWKTILSGKAWHGELIERRSDGREFIVHQTLTPVKDNENEITHFIGISQDITEKIKKEKEAAQKERQVRAMFEQSSLGMVITDLHFRFLQINKTYCRLTGYSEEELASLTFKDITHPDDLSLSTELVNQLGAGVSENYSYEKRYIRKDGETVWVSASVTLIRDEEEQPKYFLAVVEDITERKQNALAVSKLALLSLEADENHVLQHLVRNLYEVLNMKVILLGLLSEDKTTIETLSVQINGKAVDNFQYEVEGSPSEQVLEKGFICFEKYAAENFPDAVLMNSHHIESYLGMALVGNSGENIGALIICDDKKFENIQNLQSIVSLFAHRAAYEIERKRSSEQIKLSHAKLNNVLDHHPDAVLMVDDRKNIVYLNKQYIDLFLPNGNPEEFIGSDSGQTFESLKNLFAAPEEFTKQNGAVEGSDYLQMVDGRILHRSYISIKEKTTTLNHLWTYRDVTEQRTQEQLLQDNLQILNTSQRIARIGSYRLDIKTGIWKSSEMLDAIFGIEESFPHTVETWASMIHPDWQKIMTDYFAEEVLGKGIRFDKEYQIINQATNVTQWVHGLGELIVDAGGVPQIMFGTIHDITERKEYEKNIIESEQRFRSILENVSLLAVIFDTFGNIILCNDFLLNLTGWKRDEILGKNWFDIFVSKEINSGLKEYFISLLENNIVSSSYENEILTRTGEKKLIRWSNIVMRNENNQVTGLTSIGEDISEEMTIKRALMESEERYSALVQSSMDGFTITDENGKFLFANDAYLLLTGYSREELLAKSLAQIEHKENAAEVKFHLYKILQTGVDRFETQHRKKNGDAVDLLVNVTYIKSQNVFLSFLSDITERKDAEQLLIIQNKISETLKYTSEPEKAYQHITEAMLNIEGVDLSGLYIEDPETEDFILCAHFGMPEALAENVSRYVKNSDQWHLAMEGKELFSSFLSVLPNSPAKPKWKDLLKGFGIVPLSFNNNVIAVLSVGTTGAPEIPERSRKIIKLVSAQIAEIVTLIRAEAVLRESEENFKLIFENSPLGIYVARLDGQVIDGNPALISILGSPSLEATKSLNVLEYPPLIENGYTKAFLNCIRSAKTVKLELEYTSHWGKKAVLSSFIVPLKNKKGEVEKVYTLIEDVTEKKLYEGKLAQERNLLRTIIDSVPDRIFIKDTEGRFLLNNKAHLASLGNKTQEEVYGKTSFDFREQSDAQEYQKDDLQVFRQKEPILNKEVLMPHFPQQKRWFLSSKIPLLNEAKNVTGLVGIAHDITERKHYEETLKRNEIYLRGTLNSTDDGILAVDKNGKTLNFNNRFVLMWKLPAAVMETGDDAKIISYVLEQLEDPEAFLKKTKELYGSFDTSFDNINFKDGRVFERYSMPFVLDGENVGRVWSFRDVTARKTAQKQLQESEEKYRLVVENGTEAIFVVQDGVIKFANSIFADKIELPLSSIIGRPAADFFFEKDRKRIVTMHRNILAGRLKEKSIENRVQTATGKIFWVEVNAVKIQWGGRSASLNFAVDITRRKEAEQQLILSEETYRNLINNIEEAIYIQDEQGVFLDVNKTVETMYGYPREYFIGKTPEFVSAPGKNDSLNLPELLQQAFNGEPQLFEFYGIKKDGTVFPKEISLTSGSYFGRHVIFAVARDISERELSRSIAAVRYRISDYAREHSLTEVIRRTLDEAEELTQSKIGFFHFVDDDQKTLHLQTWSTNTLASFCKLKPELVHYPINMAGIWADCVREGRPLIHNDYLSEPNKKGLPEGHAPVVREVVVPIIRNGKAVAILGVGNKEINYDKNDVEIISQLAGMAWDIVLRKKAEEALKQSEERWRYALEGSGDGVWEWSSTDNRIYRSHRLKETLGYSDDELNESFNDWGSIVHPEDVELLSRELRNLINGISKKFAIEYRMICKDKTIKWIFDRAKVMEYDAEEKPSRVIGTHTDITGMKTIQHQIRELNDTLEQKVEERTGQLQELNKQLESFAYSVSHDLRAPLRAIDSFSKILLEDEYEKLSEDGKDYLHKVRNNTGRMNTLIDSLLQFSRMSRAEVHKKKFDAEQLASSIADELLRLEPERTFKLHVDRLPQAYGDPALLHHVFLNFIGNAVKFTKEKNPAEITIECSENEHELIFCVKDNGCGFDMQYADKLFGVFQRLHSEKEYSGTGVGLAIVQRIVSRHGGKVWAESVLNEGAAFYFSLPKPKQ